MDEPSRARMLCYLHCTAVAETMPAFCEECPVHVLPTLLHPLANPVDIALCRLAGAVPASLCSAKCGIQRGGDLSSCQARSVGGQSSSPALPHGRSRQGPIGCLPVNLRPGQTASAIAKAKTLFTIVQDGWASFPLSLSCPFTKQSRPSLFPYGRSARHRISSSSTFTRFKTDLQLLAKAHPPLVSLVRLTQPTRVS